MTTGGMALSLSYWLSAGAGAEAAAARKSKCRKKSSTPPDLKKSPGQPAEVSQFSCKRQYLGNSNLLIGDSDFTKEPRTK